LSVTFFATPKPFAGHIGIIQRNAISSWKQLPGDPEMILFGDETGVADICREMGLVHVPDVATNEFGTPLVSDIFDRAQALAQNSIVCFINADIVLTPRNVDAVERVSRWRDGFMVVGQRFELDVAAPLPAEADVAAWVREVGGPAPASAGDLAIDWFAFPKGRMTGLPDFAVGRTGYDNWLLWRAATSGLALVDATAYAPVFHQRHDYAHGGSKLKVWQGPEAQRQRRMVGHWSHFYTIAHAAWMLTGTGEVVPARGWRYRLARPRRVISHALRFTRPLRWRLEREPARRASEST
jgi:hypothetical protein